MLSTRQIPLALGLPLILTGGVMVPLQGRVNGALALATGDSVTAGLISFSTGLVLLLLVTVLLPQGRAGMGQVVPALRQQRIPPWYLLGGLCGAFFVLVQAGTIGPLGVSIFTVAVVTGQSISGLVVDAAGIGPGGRRRTSIVRLAGAGLTLVAVVVALWPRMQAETAVGALILLVLLPLAAGLLTSFQHAVNGSSAVAYGTAVTATTVNFMVGTAALSLIWLATVLWTGTTAPLPAEWWYYTGGPLGAAFIGLAALLVRTLGVLLVSLGMVAGQLLGSLALDVFAPTPGTVVTGATVAGVVLALAAVVLATGIPSRRPTPAPTGHKRRFRPRR